LQALQIAKDIADLEAAHADLRAQA
jgi:hypothetical protein